MKARNFIKPNESVIVFLTHSHHLFLQNNQTGLTGEWTINPNFFVDRVIIYYLNDETNTNTLYIANYAGVEAVDIEGQYNIKLTHVQYIGTTSANWIEFAEGGQNPIRYLSKKATNNRLEEKSSPQKTYSIKEIQKTYPCAYESWTKEEDERLKQSYEEGATINDLVMEFQRKPGGIRSRIKKLGLRE